MAMKQINVADATGPALDWLVAKLEGDWILRLTSFTPNHRLGRMNFSTDWAQGGPIIDSMVREGLRLTGYRSLPTDPTSCQAQLGNIVTGGQTPLIAAMRCRVVSKLGPTVEVPEELL